MYLGMMHCRELSRWEELKATEEEEEERLSLLHGVRGGRLYDELKQGAQDRSS